MNSEKKINVLIVDDSALMRRMVSDILSNHPKINVVGTASNGKMAIEQFEKLKPDVITLDIEMPIMNGLETLKEIRQIKPVPVIMFSSLTKAGAEITMQALELGAADFITKPDPKLGYTLESIKDELISKVLAAAEINQGRYSSIIQSLRTPIANRHSSITNLKTVIIGSSTGGPQALKSVVPYLPEDLPAQIMIVQHMPPKFTDLLAQRLDKLSKINVKEAQDGDALKKGHALVAPGNYHMCVDNNGNIKLNQEPSLWGVRPAIDLTLSSAAKVFTKNLICVILTGMGHDGTQGAKAVKDFGGYCIAEDKSTCVIYGMPKSVIEAGHVDKVVPLHDIANAIIEAVYR